MFIGPVFTRELITTPRRPRIYLARAVYVWVLLILMFIAWLMLTGSQIVRNVGDLSRFGMMLFQILAPLQLALAVFFSGLLAASAVALEKDRRTLILLLLTNLTNSELVLGKLLASVLNVIVLTVASLPLFMLSSALGGVSFVQIGRVFAVTLVTVLLCGSLGAMLALWREKTFQALALTVLVIVFWFSAWEIVATGVLGTQFFGFSHEVWATSFSPWQAILAATRPYLHSDPALGIFETPVNVFLLVAFLLSTIIVGIAMAMVRVWNPSREARHVTEEEMEVWRSETSWTLKPKEKNSEETEVAAPHLLKDKPSTRHVWDNPILWREIRTWAYGRKTLVIRMAYLVLFAAAAASVVWMSHRAEPITRADGAMALVPLFLLSLILVNAQAVTSITSERDTKALDLLLVTDLSPGEVVFGKLGGVFYNTKEMVVLPFLLCGYLWWSGALSLENLFYLIAGVGVLYLFVATLGIHAGINYSSSRSAVATSLGTVFFLFVGVATCMRMMIAFSGSFEVQLAPFLALTVLGGTGLYLALGARNPSNAIGVASFACPFFTFYAITSLLIDFTAVVSLVIVAAYGFATAAMLVPAIAEFDVATGRTTLGDD